MCIRDRGMMVVGAAGALAGVAPSGSTLGVARGFARAAARSVLRCLSRLEQTSTQDLAGHSQVLHVIGEARAPREGDDAVGGHGVLGQAKTYTEWKTVS